MYTYRLTQSAIRDLQEISDYISQQLFAPESARKLLDALEHAIRSGCRFPLSLPAVGDPLLRIKGYRKIIVNNYIVFVIPDEENQVLNVMRVLYRAQDYIQYL